MNTSKQINVMVALIFIAIIATGAYTIWDPDRASEADDRQTESTIERGAYLYSQNCRTCHGDAGEGGAASNRVRIAPALDRDDFRGIDAETGEVNEQTKAQQFRLIVNVITCGRVGTDMPTWGQSQGGTLNDEQIRQLATLITEGGEGWEHAKEFALHGFPPNNIHGDAEVPFSLVEPIEEGDTEIVVSDASTLVPGDRLQFGEELMVVQEVDADANTVTVERGLGTTDPEAHGLDAELIKPPVPPDPLPVTQPACGQNLPPEQADTEFPDPTTDLTIIAENTAWNTDKLSAVMGQPLHITVQNNDAGVLHNWHMTEGAEPGGDEVPNAATGEDLTTTEIEPGVVTQELDFGPLEEGDYYYVCDVHPNMEGVLRVVAAGVDPNADGDGEAGADGDAAGADATPTP
jgi:mono/diheme cytochrome c family protein